MNFTERNKSIGFRGPVSILGRRTHFAYPKVRQRSITITTKTVAGERRVAFELSYANKSSEHSGRFAYRCPSSCNTERPNATGSGTYRFLRRRRRRWRRRLHTRLPLHRHADCKHRSAWARRLPAGAGTVAVLNFVKYSPPTRVLDFEWNERGGHRFCNDLYFYHFFFSARRLARKLRSASLYVSRKFYLQVGVLQKVNFLCSHKIFRA